MTTRGLPNLGFGVTAGFTGEQAVLAVRGEVDTLGAPVLGAFIDAAIASGYPSVVVDLADVAAMDDPGMAVVTRAGNRLAASNGQLTIRATSEMTGLLSAIADPANGLRFEPVDSSQKRSGVEHTIAAPVAPVARPGASGAAVVEGLVQLHALHAATDVVDGALRLVVALARATVGGADGASVSLRRDGRLATVAASDQTVMDIDTDQYAVGEGPCVDASVEGRWFVTESLDEEIRWPAFVPKAKELGINAILSTPLLSADQPVGALNLYFRNVGAFTPRDQELASVLAAEASTILTGAASGMSAEALANRLGTALHTRAVIAQAQGVIMEQERISPEAAYRRLRIFSRTSNRPLLERAEDVVASTRLFPMDMATTVVPSGMVDLRATGRSPLDDAMVWHFQTGDRRLEREPTAAEVPRADSGHRAAGWRRAWLTR
jgi:anti-anti-sigma factor